MLELGCAGRQLEQERQTRSLAGVDGLVLNLALPPGFMVYSRQHTLIMQQSNIFQLQIVKELNERSMEQPAIRIWYFVPLGDDV